MKLLFASIAILGFTTSAFAQDRMNINTLNQQNNYSGNTNTTFLEKPALTGIEKKFVEEHSKQNTMNGFRVQLFFGSREEALKLKGEFLTLEPEQKAYVSYQAPNFKLRVGNFRSQMDAEKFLYKVKGKFPSAYVVNEKIEITKYLN